LVQKELMQELISRTWYVVLAVGAFSVCSYVIKKNFKKLQVAIKGPTGIEFKIEVDSNN